LRSAGMNRTSPPVSRLSNQLSRTSLNTPLRC
jgi:hypothetical protein